MAEEFDSSPPPADQAPAALGATDSVSDGRGPVPEPENFDDLLDRLLQEEGVATDSSSASYLRLFLERLHLDEKLGEGTGPSTARAPSPEGAEFAAAERTRMRRATAQAKVAEEQKFLCSRMAKRSEPWVSATAVMRIGAELSSSREALLRTAALAFIQGRYYEAASAVNSLAKMGLELSESELLLFDQINRSVLQKMRDEGTARSTENEQITTLLSEVVDLIDKCLLPYCPIEDCVLYNAMKGDLLAFMADAYDSGQHRSCAMFAYEEAFVTAVRTCDAWNPSRIRAAISLATFLDKSESTQRAYNIIRKAVQDIENAIKCPRKFSFSPELKSSLLLLNKLKEHLEIKLSGRKGLLPYVELVHAKPLKQEDNDAYSSEKATNKQDTQSRRRYRTMKHK